MTAREFLIRARHLDQEINAAEELKRTVRDTLTKTTQSYDSDGAQSTKNPHKFDRLAELMDKVDALTDAYISALVEITETISKVQDGRQRRVLMLYYTVKDKTGRPLTWEQVAVEMHYSWKQTRRLHAKALQAVDEIMSQNVP